jgi:hypothetical protein
MYLYLSAIITFKPDVGAVLPWVESVRVDRGLPEETGGRQCDRKFVEEIDRPSTTSNPLNVTFLATVQHL